VWLCCRVARAGCAQVARADVNRAKWEESKRWRSAGFARVHLRIDAGEWAFKVGVGGVHHKLGDGNFGTVSAATVTRGGHTVDAAVKELKQGLCTSDAFWGEVAMGSLSHQHVVRVFGGEERPPAAGSAGTEPRFFMLMELCERGSVSDHLKAGTDPLPTRLVWCRQLLATLSWLHGFGITHADLKPANLLLAAGNRASIKLCDFGLAKQDRWLSTLPSTANDLAGELRGTRVFMDPHAFPGGSGAAGKHEITAASDVYSAAITLWCILTGQTLPYGEWLQHPSRNQATIVDDFQAEARGGMRPAAAEALARQEMDSGWLPGTAALLQRMWAGSPTDRPTATEAYVQWMELEDAHRTGRRPRVVEAPSTAPLPILRAGSASMLSPELAVFRPGMDIAAVPAAAAGGAAPVATGALGDSIRATGSIATPAGGAAAAAAHAPAGGGAGAAPHPELASAAACAAAPTLPLSVSMLGPGAAAPTPAPAPAPAPGPGAAPAAPMNVGIAGSALNG
jgi:serine/threonine protein kinase